MARPYIKSEELEYSVLRGEYIEDHKSIIGGIFRYDARYARPYYKYGLFIGYYIYKYNESGKIEIIYYRKVR